MIAEREDVELNMWWQLKEGTVNFWFDNWTKQRTLYFLEEGNVQDEDMEVKQCIRNSEWVLPHLKSLIHEDMVEYIKEEIKPQTLEGWMDRLRWMKTNRGVHCKISFSTDKEEEKRCKTGEG